MAARDERRDVEEGAPTLEIPSLLLAYSPSPLLVPFFLPQGRREKKNQDNKHTSSMDARHGLDRHSGEMTWQ